MRQPHGLPPRPASARRRGNTVTTVVRAAFSFLLLAGLLAGLPVLLWWGTSIVAGPGIAALGNLLSTQDSGQVFLLALAVVAWVGWGLFAVSVLLEIPAQLRGHAAPRMRLLLGQRAAATLVGAVLLALPTGTALASPTPAHAVSQAATPHLGSSVKAADVTTTAAAGDQHGGQRSVAYTVRDIRPAESLWSIAEQHLGDGNRWEEIARLNQGRTMVDGTVFDAGHVIQPGWVLQLPADANPQAADAGPHVDGGRSGQADTRTPAEYTVKAGDNLSQIAQKELGDATKYPEIFQLNKGEPQPDGEHFTDPNLILPDQQLKLPAAPTADQQPGDSGDPSHAPATSGTTADPGNGPSSKPSPAPPSTPPSQAATAQPASPTATQAPSSAPTHSAASTPTPSTTASSEQQPTATPTPAPPRTASPTTIPAPAHAASAETNPLQRMVWAGGIAALLAAGLLGSLGVKRILQQRRRKAGETIAIDPDPTRLEQVLHASAEPLSVNRLDLALRTLAHQAAATGTELPTVRGAQVTDRTVRLLIDDPAASPIAPFTAGPYGCWDLDPAALLLDAGEARDVPAPYPGLLTLGATDAGHLLLANLLHSRALLLDGDDEDILAVARAMALEAGTCGWSDHTEIITIGLGARLATLLPQGRIRTMPHLPAVISDLGALLVEVHQQQSDSPEPLPWILICAAEVDPEHAWQLADAVSAARGLPVSVVLPACDATRSLWPDADTIPVTADAEVRLDHLGGETITVQRLTDEQYLQYVHALQVADEPAQPATGAWQLASDHDHAATTPPPEPVPLLLQAVQAGDDADPGDPFPALLASSEGRIRLVKPTPVPDVEQSDDPPAEPAITDTDDAPEVAVETSAPVVPAATEATDGENEEPTGPEINVLGPIEATGISSSGHGPKVAALAALILLRPGRSADTLCTSMDPLSPWSTRTLQSRLSEIRSRFGNDPNGNPYLPRPRGGYSFAAGVRSDWTRFQRLATRALAAGPEGGIADLETALALVRAQPFDGADYPWADAIQQEMISRIVDVAHTLATWHAQADAPDLDAARRAVLSGLDIDETAEVLYRDWLLIEHTAGNHAGVRKVVTRIQHLARTYDIDMDPLTEQTITRVLGERPSAAHVSRL